MERYRFPARKPDMEFADTVTAAIQAGLLQAHVTAPGDGRALDALDALGLLARVTDAVARGEASLTVSPTPRLIAADHDGVLERLYAD